jgi:hypothetical protein
MRLPVPLGSKLQLLLIAMAFSSSVLAQDVAAPPASTTVEATGLKPVPDIAGLMYEVEAHQKKAEAIQKNYLYHSAETQQERDGGGAVKKTTVKEYDVFWVSGVPVRRLVKKDGRDLTPDEQKKESDHIDKEVAKAQEKKGKAESKGNETTPRGNDEITVSRFLELGSFTNARRVQLDGRDTILVDYAGNPKAKTHNRGEDVVRDLVGTIWIDEQDRVIRKTEGHFLNNFKIGGGLLVNIRKDTSFGLDQRKINDEVWLPARIEAQGSARALLLFSFNGSVVVRMSDYRKFKATSTILPGVATVDESTPGSSNGATDPASKPQDRP